VVQKFGAISLPAVPDNGFSRRGKPESLFQQLQVSAFSNGRLAQLYQPLLGRCPDWAEEMFATSNTYRTAPRDPLLQDRRSRPTPTLGTDRPLSSRHTNHVRGHWSGHEAITNARNGATEASGVLLFR